MFIVIYFKNILGCLLIPRPAMTITVVQSTVCPFLCFSCSKSSRLVTFHPSSAMVGVHPPCALLPWYVSPSPTPPELRSCVAAVPACLSRGPAPATGDCFRSQHPARVPSTAAGGRPLRWVLPRSAIMSLSRAGHCAVCRAVAVVAAVVVDRGNLRPDPRAPPRQRVVAAWLSPSCGVLPSIGPWWRRSWSRVRLVKVTGSWLLVSYRIVLAVLGFC